MTTEKTGIDVIDEVDAALQRWDDHETWDGDFAQRGKGNVCREAYPKLRAILLRLQEEGRSARAQVQDAVDEVERLRAERDALLEAAKEAEELAHLEAAWDTASRCRSAIDNVEGKDG